MVTFGTKLKVMRIFQNLSQAELARQVNLQQYDISLFEADKAIPSGQVREALKDALGVDLDAPHIDRAFSVLAGQTNTQLDTIAA